MASGLLDYLSNSGQGLLNMYRQAPGVLGDWAMNTAAPALMSLSPGAAIQDSMQSGRDAGASLQGGDYMGALKNMGWGMLAAGGVIPGAGTAERAGVQGIRAYHGSPHSFDTFDLSKIGSGEGAQAYGHGLYFAGNEDVARSYRDNLSRQVSVDGKPLNMHPSDAPGAAVANEVVVRVGNGEDPATAIKNVAQGWRDYSSTYRDALNAETDSATRAALQQEIGRHEDLAKAAEGLDPASFAKNPGHMYEVNINADPASLLDWDKPLSQQSPQVQQAFQKFGIDAPSGEEAYRQLARHVSDNPDRYGMDFYTNPLAALTSRTLHEEGVPGIQYLDQGSRGAGEGSRNYVVFHDQLVDILRKYGLAGMLGGGAAAGYALAPSDAQAGQEQR